VRNYLIELGRAYQVALKELRVVDVNPITLVNKPAASPWRVRFLNEDEQVRLIAACKSSASPDLYCFMLFCLTTGCRKGEAAGLLWTNIDLVRRWAVFPVTKNGTARGVPLTRAVVELFEARPRDDARVFPRDITSAWHSAIECAAITDFHFHDLRHTAASRLVMAGASLIETATLLGHKTPTMTMRYSHLANSHTASLVDRVMGELS
jgi:integrase